MKEFLIQKALLKGTKNWIFGTTFKSFNRFFVMTGSDYEEVEEESICINTGLKDISNKRIMDNDIVQSQGLEGNHEVFVVCYKKEIASFVLCNIDLEVVAPFDEFTPKNLKVIGNIKTLNVRKKRKCKTMKNL